MSDLKPQTNLNEYNADYIQDTPVKITKGSLKDCQGKISGCTVDGIYFVRIVRCEIDTNHIRKPIDLFLPNEFEPLDEIV